MNRCQEFVMIATRSAWVAVAVAVVICLPAHADHLWLERESFLGNPGVGNDLYGSVDIQGDTLFVGGRIPVRVDAYTNVGGTWTFDETISGNGFGSSLDGSTAIIMDNPIVNVLEDQAGTWTNVAAISTPNITSATKQGSTIVVGDRNADVAYVYDDAGGNTWGLTQTLSPTGTGTAEQFGRRVYYDGVDTIAVADSRYNPGGINKAGAVFVYQNQAGTWTQIQRIDQPGGGGVEYEFGGGLAGDGDLLVVGAPGTPSDFRGTAYVYEQQVDGTFSQLQQLAPASITGGFEYGFDVDIDGDTIVVGGQLDRGKSNNLGGAYMWELDGGSWVEVEDPLQSGDVHDDDLFGANVAVSGSWTAISALFWNRAGGPPGGGPKQPWEGKAYTFERIPEPGALSLLAIGGLALSCLSRRRRR